MMDDKKQISSTLRWVVLIELILPMILLVLGVLMGLGQSLARAGWIKTPALFGINYYQALTIHGVVNAIVFTTFFAVAFGHILVSYYLDCRLSRAAVVSSFLLMLIGTLAAAWAMLLGKADVLYTFYPPLQASPAFYIGATLLVVGSWVAFFSWLPPYLQWRRQNPGKKTPLAVMGILATFLVWFIATLPLAYEVIVMLIPWSLGWVKGVNVMLARTLFWFFGHPLVYFWIMPAYVMYYCFLPRLCGGKLYSDAAARFSFFGLLLFSIPVGVHHQYADPAIGVSWKWLQGLLTFVVALPSFITAFSLAASMEHGAKQQGGRGWFQWWTRLPYLDQNRWLFSYFFAGLLLFLFGGITGIINASLSMNNVVHNTAWIPGHFHTTVGGPVLLAFLAMSLHLTSGLLGKPIRFAKLNQWVAYLWVGGIAIFSTGLSIAGLQGMPRRTHLGLSYSDPSSALYNPQWHFWSKFSAMGGVIMFISMALFFLVFFTTCCGRRQSQPGVALPTSQPYHDEDVPLLMNFKPWLVALLLLIAISYIPPIYDVLQATTQTSPAYLPTIPIPKP